MSKETPTHVSWRTMMSRCYYRGDSYHWKYYGGRGVVVCEQWHNFARFYADMGERPTGTTLDRYPNNQGNYEPSNCRWATAAQQQKNKTQPNAQLTFHGRTMSARAWGREFGLSHATLLKRIKLGWPVERMSIAPIRRQA